MPENVFAPSLARWGLNALKRVFQTGHILTVERPVIESLVARIAAAIALQQPGELTPGVNLIGFAYGEFGLGESLRVLARACRGGSIPFIVKDVDQRLQTRQADRSIAGHVSDELRHRLSLMCLNPDLLKSVCPLLRAHPGGRRTQRRLLVLGARDTSPRTWEPTRGGLDEMWCATEFVATAIRRATARPVMKIPPPMEVALSRRAESRAEFGLPTAPLPVPVHVRLQLVRQTQESRGGDPSAFTDRVSTADVTTSAWSSSR